MRVPELERGWFRLEAPAAIRLASLLLESVCERWLPTPATPPRRPTAAISGDGTVGDGNLFTVKGCAT